MSKVNELLDDLFVEMIREGHEEMGIVKEFLGINFNIYITIKADLEKHNSKLIQEYEDSNSTPVVMPDEKVKVEPDLTFWITRDKKNGLLIHTDCPIMRNDSWVSYSNSYKLKHEKPYLDLLDEAYSDKSKLQMQNYLFHKAIIGSTGEIRSE